MGQVLIRNLDDAVIRAIKLKAELKGHSLEQELRDIIGRAADPATTEEKVAMSRRMRDAFKMPEDFDVTAAIRHGREDAEPQPSLGANTPLAKTAQ